ncbi:MAG: phosphogluconate dehydratase [Pseudomonadota bacterium]|uniref:phosphogluconate dehydratase n=1 Tax=Gallaecimonas pentaromativorans TaxID=584787 RepID=UPI00067F38EC|nr:phosphogluconate dehydratase [Gallaecimonas pentaromativorans]MED5525591.1 phosphogluconate dehydratase [Pseudomonadota bacterium]
MNKVVAEVTARIEARSKGAREQYLNHIAQQRAGGVHRSSLSCGNLAHGFAACGMEDKDSLKSFTKANIAIVSAYNDMLSAHQPYETYPALIKKALHEVGSVAQFAGGVPAMCDGVTQGQPGMELSLLSRDIIAMSSAVALSHNMFDGGLMLGICDKIVPGLLIASATFGHLPFVFVPAGPMPSGMPNKEKARIREAYAQGQVDRNELLRAESESYHSAGTCTFYGTANSNQLMVEVMGMQLPGSSFVNPNTKLRDALTEAAAKQVARLSEMSGNYTPFSEILTAKTLVNAMVALLATGGSTNHTMHLVAVGRAAGITINWDDFDQLSKVVPLLTRIYPNGQADINHFQAAGGMGYLIKALRKLGLLNEDVKTIVGTGLDQYELEPWLNEGKLEWRACPEKSLDTSVLADPEAPFSPEGGLKVLHGNLGRGVIKVSAVPSANTVIEAPAVVFSDQHQLDAAFKAGDLNRDCIVVVRFQGPKANGMPELHKLTPPLGVLQEKGYKVALVTDGRMSGASGKVPAAIHLTPEALDNPVLTKVQDGDIIRLDSHSGELTLLVDEAELAKRECAKADLLPNSIGMGRGLFMNLRPQLCGAEQGATLFRFPHEDNQ